MAHIWQRPTDAWRVLPIEKAVILRRDETSPMQNAEDLTGVETAIVRHAHGREEGWVLLAPPQTGIWVNGNRVPLGILSLNDRDEIRLRGGETMYFSTERLAHIEAFPGSEKTAVCPRCKQSIEAGSSAVCCPSCGAWYHESADLGCWTYAETCCACGLPTALDAGYRWTPEGL